MKKLRREARILKDKAVSSMRRGAGAFNSYDEDGRTTAVLLHVQHAFEMLLKAGLVEQRQRVFDPKDGKSLGLERCLNLSVEHLKLDSTQAGIIRAIDAMRDEEQHWFSAMSEGLLYAHVRAAVTTFDEILASVFGEKLADHVPTRVLPISAEAPQDIQLLIDSEYSQIQRLLKPGNRRRPEARARIRTLLAMEAHVAEGVIVSRKDVDRVETAVRADKTRREIFPRLGSLATDVAGEGLTVKVRITKGAGAPVTFVPADDPREAAAVREVDLQRKYHLSAQELAERLGITMPLSFALRQHLGIDEDEACRHEFVFRKSVHIAFSDNALRRMQQAAKSEDLDAIWQQYRPRPGRS